MSGAWWEPPEPATLTVEVLRRAIEQDWERARWAAEVAAERVRCLDAIPAERRGDPEYLILCAYLHCGQPMHPDLLRDLTTWWE